MSNFRIKNVPSFMRKQMNVTSKIKILHLIMMQFLNMCISLTENLQIVNKAEVFDLNTSYKISGLQLSPY